MNILVVNDDGWDAPGLAALEQLAREYGDVWSIAPLEHMSGCGHQLTLHRPLAIREIDDRHWAVDGTPADCVRLAIARWKLPFDWVWSGINEGSNLGCDIFRSGTIAAAREAALLGLRACAISQYQRAWQEPFDWSVSIGSARRAWQALAERPLPRGRLWNVNLPDPNGQEGVRAPLPNLVDCPADPSPLPMDYQHVGMASHYCGRYAERPRVPGCDIEACFGGAIAVSLI